MTTTTTTTTTTFKSGIERFLASLYSEREVEVTNAVKTRLEPHKFPALSYHVESDILAHHAHGSILRGHNGEITIDEFTKWLSEFMSYGSDTKLAICDISAWKAMTNFMDAAMCGYRRISDNEPDPTTGIVTTTYMTPYGRLDLTSVKETNPENPQGRVTVVDIATFIYDEENWSRANGIASGILRIIA